MTGAVLADVLPAAGSRLLTGPDIEGLLAVGIVGAIVLLVADIDQLRLRHTRSGA